MDILLIDDEPSIRVPLGHELRTHGHHVAIASDGAQAMSLLDEQVFHLVVSDVRLPKVDGFTILRRLRSESPQTDVLLMTAFGTIPDAVTALKERAVDYVTKPFDLQEMVIVVDRIDERRRLIRELEDTRAQLAARHSKSFLTGRTPRMVRLRDQISAVADSDAGILISGESGTGKERVARMVHDLSSRRDKPFVTVNCAAVPPTLIEAELFGHERGAFTGAIRKRDGRFKAADGGTLFLDEIGELPVELQPKLLRVLQEGTFEPIGTNTTVTVDVRLISASNVDLKAAAGNFRQDLFYRIRVFDLCVPPLRERMSDLPMLVSEFLKEFTVPGQEPPRLSGRTWAALERYTFPGNVRELKHAIQHAAILARGGEIDTHHLPRDILGEATAPRITDAKSLSDVLDQYEREYIERTVRLAGGERKAAAALLGISRKGLWQKMVKYGIS